MPPPSLSLTDWVVLGVLAETPRHGFAVAREVAAGAELGQIWTIRRPLVYRSLDHLSDLGLVEPRVVEPGDQGPHRTVLAPTRSGRARLQRWLDQPVEHPRDVRTELLVKFALRTRRGLPLRPLATAQQAKFGDILSGLEQRVHDTRNTPRVIAQWRHEANVAIQRFLDAVIAEERVGSRRTISS